MPYIFPKRREFFSKINFIIDQNTSINKKLNIRGIAFHKVYDFRSQRLLNSTAIDISGCYIFFVAANMRELHS